VNQQSIVLTTQVTELRADIEALGNSTVTRQEFTLTAMLVPEATGAYGSTSSNQIAPANGAGVTGGPAMTSLRIEGLAAGRWPARRAGLAALLLAAASSGAMGDPRHTITLVDTLGAATPQTVFSIPGTSGQAVALTQFVGPRFTLTEPSVIVRVGGFLNNCRAIGAGVPECPDTRPLVVQIRREVNGAPDPVLVVAAVPLSDDADPLTVSFESASLDDVVLEPGTYYALFAPQQALDGGFLLGQQSAVGYLAGVATVGYVSPERAFSEPAMVAVQVIAKPVRRHKGRHHGGDDDR